MDTSRQRLNRETIGVPYAPQNHPASLPVEVIDRSELVGRIAGRELDSYQRAEFHQLIVCTAGAGVHYVDYEPVQLRAGTLLRIYPGQVQQFMLDSDLEVSMVIWPRSSHYVDPEGRIWYPGSADPTHWSVDEEMMIQVLAWVDELKYEQDRFAPSRRKIELMKVLLCSLLLRLAIELPESLPASSKLPAPYLDFRELIEVRLYDRPSIADLARDVGYSSRTLDRACKEVSGQTAKQVFDERIAFEVRRLLTHSSRPISSIARDFGFDDASNFSKFVKRHLGNLPRQIREDHTGSATD